MAANWLKMRHDLADDPAVIQLADIVQIEDDAVIGKLFRLWSWADRHTRNGRAEGISLVWVDRLARCDGFGAALVRVGWLAASGEGLSFPRFDRHCSDTAKTRALDAMRKQSERASGECPDGTRTESGQNPDRLRTKSGLEEEKKREELPPLPREGFDTEAWQSLRKAWNAGPGKKWKPVNPPQKAVERLADPDWVAMYVEAIDRLRSCRFFDDPVSLNQFCGPDFVTNTLGGLYDNRKRPNCGRPEDDARRAALERTAAAFSGARPGQYRRPAEAVALAERLKLKEEDR